MSVSKEIPSCTYRTFKSSTRTSLTRYTLTSGIESISTYALVALADRNPFIIWKLVKFICPTIVEGEYMPAAVRAAPNIAPERTLRHGKAVIVLSTFGVIEKRLMSITSRSCKFFSQLKVELDAAPFPFRLRVVWRNWKSIH
jgi:hypothetical protein